MQPLDCLRAAAVPLPGANTNTDQILPGRFMHKERLDYGRYCFHDLRFDADGVMQPGFILNQPAYAGAQILVAGANFGCGSSREHAVFTLCDYGLRAIVAPSFGDIFYINCLKNGLLPAVLPAEAVASLTAQLLTTPGAQVAVDLPAQTVVAPDGSRWTFPVDEFSKGCLLRGLDEIDLTMSLTAFIDAFEARRRAMAPVTPVDYSTIS